MAQNYKICLTYLILKKDSFKHFGGQTECLLSQCLLNINLLLHVMRPENFKLIVITPEKEITEEANLLTNLFESGLQLLHLRKPDYTINEIRNLITDIPAIFHPKIVLHSHYELLNDFNLKGIHLPEKLRLEGNTKQIKNIVSTSFHKIEDILSTKTNFEYAFLSPIFQSISKEGYEPVIKPNVLKDFFRLNKINFPVIALGGITDQNVIQVRDIGFFGAACIGYVWENPNPIQQFKKLQKLIQG